MLKATVKPNKYRQKLLASKLSENIGKPEGELLREAGYSKSYAESGHIKKTASWLAMMEKYYPDKQIAKTIQDLLNANKTLVVGDKNLKEIVETKYPDYQWRSRGVELALKTKGYFTNSPTSQSDEDGQELREVILRIRQILPAAGQ